MLTYINLWFKCTFIEYNRSRKRAKMKHILTIKYEDDIVKAYVTRDNCYKGYLDVWTEIMMVCKEYNCFNILSVQDLTPLSAEVALAHEIIFKVGITKDYRLALIDTKNKNHIMLNIVKSVGSFLDTLTLNIFSDESKAKDWLIKN